MTDWKETGGLKLSPAESVREVDDVETWLKQASLNYRVFTDDAQWAIYVSDASAFARAAGSNLTLSDAPLVIAPESALAGEALPTFPLAFAYLAIIGGPHSIAEVAGIKIATDLASDFLAAVAIGIDNQPHHELALYGVEDKRSSAPTLSAKTAHPRIEEPSDNLKGREDWFQKRHGGAGKPRTKPGSKQ